MDGTLMGIVVKHLGCFLNLGHTMFVEPASA